MVDRFNDKEEYHVIIKERDRPVVKVNETVKGSIAKKIVKVLEGI